MKLSPLIATSTEVLLETRHFLEHIINVVFL